MNPIIFSLALTLSCFTSALGQETVSSFFEADFLEFTLSKDTLYTWGYSSEEIFGDTAMVDLDLGGTVQGQTFALDTVVSAQFKVYQQHKNSVTLMNEGPHCDLNHWKHYRSDWVELPIVNGTFTTLEYSEEESEKFIDVSAEELQSAFAKKCGEHWIEIIEKVTSPNSYPCGVSTSSITLRVDVIFETEAEINILHRYIIFEIPMGC